MHYYVTLAKRGIFGSDLISLIRPAHLLDDLRSLEAVLGPRAAAVNRRLEFPVLFSALLVLPLFLIELIVPQGWSHPAAVIINWVIWTAFALEFTLLISLTEHRLAYIRKDWLHTAVIPFAFPLVPHIFSDTDLEGVVRTLRFILLLAVLAHSCWVLYQLLVHTFFDLLAIARHPWLFLLGPLLRKRGLGIVVLLFGGLAVASGLLHAFFEKHSVIEGLWWSLVTLTTVGYGDISPVTLGGRITGAALMLSGIGVLAFTTANIAAFFVEGDYEKDLHREVQSVNERLDRIEALLISRIPPASED